MFVTLNHGDSKEQHLYLEMPGGVHEITFADVIGLLQTRYKVRR